MHKFSFFSPLLLLSFIALSSCGGHGGGSSEVAPSVLASIEARPSGGTSSLGPGIVIPTGTSLHYIATGIYTDGTTRDITAEATWTSSDNSMATISNDAGYNGLLTALQAAPAITITATMDGITGSATLSISPARGNSWRIGLADPLFGISWNSTLSQFVATGQGGTILTSPTGTEWTPQVSGTTESLWAAANNGVTPNTNVIVGSNGTILYSQTGTTTTWNLISWNTVTSGSPRYLWDVAWSGDKFIAVGEEGTILTSQTGTMWTMQTSTVTLNNLNGVACNGSGTCIAVGSNNTILSSSTDGLSWQPETSNLPTSRYLWGVAWSPDLSGFVAVGSNGTIIHRSSTGSWIGTYTGTSLYLDRITWSGNKFVAVGESGIVLTSPNGTSWTRQTAVTGNFLWGVASSGTRFAAVGLDGVIISSPGGGTWTETGASTTNNINGVARSGTETAAVGDNGTVFISPTGGRWTQVISGTTNTLNSVAAMGVQFIAVGNAGTIVTSPTRTYEAWTSLSSGTSNNLNGVAANWFPFPGNPLPLHPTFVAVGDSGTILYSQSPTGTGWSAPLISYTSNNLNSVAFGVVSSKGIFVAVGASGTILYSTNGGSTWSSPTINSLSSLDLVNVTWSGSEFVAADSSGATHVSPTGTIW